MRSTAQSGQQLSRLSADAIDATLGAVDEYEVTVFEHNPAP